MEWAGNTLVAEDRSLFTVLDDGTLEIRGDGWDRKRKKKEHPDTDRPRVLKFKNKKIAVQMAEAIARFSKAHPYVSGRKRA
jgi:hypothetical protein